MKRTSTNPKSKSCSQHEWVVFSTCVGDEPCLLVQCAECYATGAVFETTLGEWRKAYHAPEKPYRWNDDSRVTLLGHESKPYIVKRAARSVTKCLNEDTLITAFHHWLESGRPESVEVDGQRHEWHHLSKVMRKSDRCLPDDCCDNLGLPRFATYGDAVQHLAVA